MNARHRATLVHPFFLADGTDRCFCVYYPAAQPCRGAYVHVPAFAEEMNKSRRIVTLQAQRMAALGYAVLVLDLAGTGDSSGEFVDARWEAWQDNVLAAMTWLRQESGQDVSLWGLRLGALLAAEVSHRAPALPPHLLMWQPAASGQRIMTQFLRLHMAKRMIDGDNMASTTTLRAHASQGTVLEVSGYELHPALLAAIDQAAIGVAAPRAARIDWLEMCAGEATLPASAYDTITAWRAQGSKVKAHALACPPFWTSQEIMAPDALLEASSALLEQEAAA